MLIVLLGGARSGKSALAVRLARARGGPTAFLATADAGVAGMGGRIARHRAERPPQWRTIEEPVDLARVIATLAPQTTLLIDCLSLWTGAAMAAGADVEALATGHAKLAAARPGLTVAVSNEVGMGVHPVSEIGREYRDVHGRVNAIWARAADRALLVVAGRLLELARAEALLEELA